MGAPVKLREPGPLKAEVLVLYRLEDQSSKHFPSGLSKRRAVEKTFYSDAALPAFPSQSCGCSILSLNQLPKTGFSAVMQTKSLITFLGLSSRSHNYGTFYYAN